MRKVNVREVGERLAASYVNFYFSNNAVVMPVFGGENEDDLRAQQIMAKLCPGQKNHTGVRKRHTDRRWKHPLYYTANSLIGNLLYNLPYRRINSLCKNKKNRKDTRMRQIKAASNSDEMRLGAQEKLTKSRTNDPQSCRGRRKYHFTAGTF